MMPTKKRRKPQGIVWSIDPFEAKVAHRAPLAKAIAVFSQGLSQPVLPFSVVSPGGLAWPVPVTFSVGKDLRAFGERSVARSLEKLRLRNVQAPAVEVRESSSRRELVNSVLRYAQSRNAGYIAVNTRRLLSPFPFKIGGFAEALLARSRLPVLAVSPKAKVSSRIRRILFPTDFSLPSRHAFRETLAIASRLGAEIALVHVELPLLVPFSYPGEAPGAYEVYLADAERERHERNRAKARRWIEEAKRSRVRCVYLPVREEFSVSAAILKSVKRARADLISLAGYRSPNTPAILGGTVRDVLGSAGVPVLEF